MARCSIYGRLFNIFIKLHISGFAGAYIYIIRNVKAHFNKMIDMDNKVKNHITCKNKKRRMSKL